MATILIIDDQEPVRVLLRFALEAVGYEVVEAANGRQGLELYRPGRRTWSLPTFSCLR
jgi:CheY-like chemotaxis protein